MNVPWIIMNVPWIESPMAKDWFMDRRKTKHRAIYHRSRPARWKKKNRVRMQKASRRYRGAGTRL